MKKLLFALAVLIAWRSQAQTIQFLGTPTTQIYVRGQLRVDSIVYLPLRDTTFTPSQVGALVVKASNKGLYLWNGLKWNTVPVGSTAWGTITGSIASQSDLIALLNGYQPSLTAGYGVKLASNTLSWDSASVRKVDTVYRTDDSTISYSINGHTYSVLIRGTAAGGINSLLLNVPNVLYTSPVVFANTGGAWSGSAVLISQTSNTVFAGPTSGSPAQPTFRNLELADLPVAIPNANLQNSNIALSLTSVGTTPNWGAASVSLGGSAVLNIPYASSTSNGLITNTDWINFNNATNAPVTSVNAQLGAVVVGNADSIKKYPVDTSVNRNGYALTFDSINHKFKLAPGSTTSGTVTSVGLTVPSFLTVGGSSPVTGAGTLAVATVNQSANTVLAGPTSGLSAAPGFRSIVNADFPTSGVTGGTYNSVTVNAQGIVIAGSVVGAGITTLNGLTAGTQTFATGTSGSDFNIASIGTTHTFNFPNSSASNRGLLTNTDWSFFNAKQAAGNYITALTTDVVASGPGSAAATIQPNVVSYSKIQAAASAGLMGATTAGNFGLITLGSGLAFSGSVLNATAAGVTLQSKNAAIAVSGDSVQAQNLAFVDSTSNGVLGVLYDSLSWNSPLGYLQQSGSGVTVASSQIQLVEADNNGTVYVRLPTNTCLDQQVLSANFVIKATNAGDSGAMVSSVSVNTHSVSSLYARLNTTTRKVELLSNQNGSTTIIASSATLPASITTGDSLTVQLINNSQVITAQAIDRTTANTISVSFTNTFVYTAPLFIANTGQVTFNSGNGTYQLNRLTYSSNLPKNQRIGVVGYSITQGYAAGSIAGTWSRSIGSVVSAGSADYTASLLLPGRLQEMHALGQRNWIIGGLAGNDIQFGISSAVWQANLVIIYDSIISWGSNCYFTLETPRNSVDITAANTFIKATWPNLYIDLFTPLWSGTSYTMNAAYVTDGTHPNAAGHTAMAKAVEQSFVYNLIQNGAQIPVVTPITPGAATTVQVSTGTGITGYSEFFYDHALTQLYSHLIAGSATTGQGLMFHSNSVAGNGIISFGSTTTGMNYQENNASLAIGTATVTSGTKLDVRGGGIRVGTTNAGMILPDFAGSGPATAGSVLVACGACGSGQGLVLDANSNAGTSGAFVKAVAYNGTTLRTVWEYSNTTGGAVPTLKIMDSAGFVQFGATSADTLSSKARGSYTTNLGSTFTPYSWIDYNSADSLAKKRAHDSAVAYAINPKKFAMTADGSVNNTSTPTSLIGTGVGSMTIPANSLIAGSAITFKGSGTITAAATPPTMSFALSVGTSSSATAPTITPSLNGSYEFQFDCIVRTTGAGGTCEFTGWVSIAGTKSYIAAGSFALDTTTGNLVDLVLTMGGTVGSGDVVTTKTSSLIVQ